MLRAFSAVAARARRVLSWTALAVALGAVGLGAVPACQTTEVSTAQDTHWFNLPFNLTGVQRGAIERLTVTIFQLSEAEERARAGVEADKYLYDVLARISNGVGTVNGLNVTGEVRDVNSDGRRDLVFTVGGNPFANTDKPDSFTLSVLHAPWGRKDASGRVVPPPPFKVRLDAFREDVVVATSGLRELPAGTLFSGPNISVDTIGVGCVPGQEGVCGGDGGVVRPDGGGPLPSEYAILAPELTRAHVSPRQALGLRYRIKNGTTRDIAFFAPAAFSVNNVPPNQAGFTFTARPENATITRLGRGEEATFGFDVATFSAERVAEAGPYTFKVRVDAFESATAEAQKQLRFDLADSPSFTLQIDRPATLDIALPVAGPTELFQGDPGTLSLRVHNSGEVQATGVVVTPILRRGTTDEPPTGVVIPTAGTPFTNPTELAPGATQEFRFPILAAADAPPQTVRVSATVTAVDGNDPTRQVGPTPTPRETSIAIRGSANLLIASTRSELTTAFLGQRGVRVYMVLDNSAGQDDARVENPRLRFLDRTGADVSSAGWTQVGTPTGLDAASLVPAGQVRELLFTYDVNPVGAGQVGENEIQASCTYVTVGRGVRSSLATARNPYRLIVVFAPGPKLAPTDSEVSSRYGQSVAGLGLVNYRGSTWPAIAVGAPDASNGSGAVHFFQFVRDTTGVGPFPLFRASGVAGARFGEALAPVGKWQRTSDTDLSAEVAIGRPGQSNLTVFSVAQSSPATEPLPAGFTPCSGCALGEVLAGNPGALDESGRSGERRLLVAGAPQAGGNLGRIDIFWQTRPAEGALCQADDGCTAFPSGTCSVAEATTAGSPVRRCTYLRNLRIDGEQVGERFGASVALADVDGDGDLDVVVGAPGFVKTPGEAPRGRVRVFRAPDFQRFPAAWTYVEGETPGEGLGAAVAGLGDLDGDGMDDLALGAPRYAANGQTNVGRVHVISGKTGNKLYSLEGRAWPIAEGSLVGEGFGSSLTPLFQKGGAQASDFNGDGRPDFAVGAPTASPGQRRSAGAVYVFSGPKVGDAPGRQLLRYDGVSEQDLFGTSVAAAGDVNFDGFHDLVVGAPNALDVSDNRGVRRGSATIFYGGPFEPFQRPPGLSVSELRDPQAPLTTGALRTVTIGQTVSVKVMVASTGDVATQNVNVDLLVRRRVAENPPGEVVGPTLVRITKVGHPTSLAAAPSDPAPGSLATATYVPFEFQVVIERGNLPELWEVSARLSATGIPAFEIPVSTRRPWVLQREPQLQVLAIQTAVGNTELGFTSINPGAPVEMTADLVNSGDATITELATALLFRSGVQDHSGLVAELLEQSGTTLRKGETVRARFRVTVNSATSAAPIFSGQEFLARVSAHGVDANTGLPVTNEQSAVTVARLVASRLRLRITSLSAESGATNVRPGQTDAGFRYTVVLDPDTESPGASVGRLVHGLTFSVQPTQWTVREGVGNVTRIGACETATCVGDSFSVRANVPTAIPPGAVRVGGAITAFDELAGVIVRGESEPTVAAATTTINVLGIGSPIASVQRSLESGFGSAIARLGDVNGDGAADFAVGAPLTDGQKGAVFLLDGKRVLSQDPAMVLGSPLAGGATRRLFGQALAGGYNLSASLDDALPDLVIGAPGAGGSALPAAFLQPLASALGQPVLGAQTLLTASLPAPQRSAQDQAGASVTLGDLNGDGCPDVVVGLPGASTPGGVRSGAVCVRFGRTAFAAVGSNPPATCAPTCSEVCFSEGADGEHFGAAVSAYQPTGFQRFFLAVGAPGATLGSGAGTSYAAGRVYVYSSVSCTGAASSIRIEASQAPTDPSAAHLAFGAALGHNRVYNTATAAAEKLLIGAPGEPPPARCDGGRTCPAGTTCDATSTFCLAVACTEASACGSGNRCVAGLCSRRRTGVVYALSGTPSLLALTAVDHGEAPDDLFGSVVASAGDVDGDGVGDYAIGAPGGTFHGAATGRVTVRSGRDGLALYRLGVAGETRFGQALEGVGRVNDDAFDDVAIGAAGKVFIAAGLERPAIAQLRLDAVRPEVPSVVAGQVDAGVLLTVTNVGRADAYRVEPSLLFAPDRAAGAAATSYRITRVFARSVSATGAVTDTEVTSAAPLTLGAGRSQTLRLLVTVGADTPEGLATIDAAVTTRNGSADGVQLAVRGADLPGAWTVQRSPRMRVVSVSTGASTVFQGQQRIPVTVTVENQSSTQPTQVGVRLLFTDTTTRRAVTSGYALTQTPAAAAVTLSPKACADVAACGAGETCTGGLCSVTRTATVRVDVDVAADATVGEQELSAEVTAPPLPGSVVGPPTAAGRGVWTVLPAGVVDVTGVSFAPLRTALSAGQRGVVLRVHVRNTGTLTLRDVRPTLFYPVVAGVQPAGRTDLPTPTLLPSQSEIAPGQSIEVSFNLDLPDTSSLTQGLGTVIFDARATARDAYHEVRGDAATVQASVTLQQPATPRLLGKQLQGLVFRGERSVEVAVSMANGNGPAACVDGVCTPGPQPTADWTELQATICFQNPPQVAGSAACDYSQPLLAQSPSTAIVGNGTAELRYEFDAPANAPLGTTRAVLRLGGKDKNTGLDIAPFVIDTFVFLMRRDNSAGQLLGDPVAAPAGAVRFGATLAAAPVQDARKALVVVGAPESEPDPSGQPRGRVYVYAMQARTGQSPSLAPLAQWSGEDFGDAFGRSVTILRGANGMARTVAVAAPGRSEGGISRAGAIYLYDATTLQLVARLIGAEPELQLGTLGAGADLDGDAAGSEELVVGLPGYAGGQGRVLVFSGSPPFGIVGAPLDGTPRSRFGSSLAASAGFLSQGAPGLLVGAPRPSTGTVTGSVFTYSGNPLGAGIATPCGSTLPAALAGADGRQTDFGAALAVFPSITGAVCPDFAVGAPKQDHGQLSNAGAVYVASSGRGYFSGAGPLVLRGQRAQGNFGQAVLPVGNWNEDLLQHTELAIGAPGATVGGVATATAYPSRTAGVGMVNVYRTDRAVSIFRAEGDRALDQAFGAALAAVDLNDDGIPDLVVGAPGVAGGSNGRIYVYQGGQPQGGALRVDSLQLGSRTTAARGVPVAPWPGLELTLTVTNAGKSAVSGATPSLRFQSAAGGSANGIWVRSVSPGLASDPTLPAPQTLASESTFTWTYRLDLSSVASPTEVAIVGAAQGTDVLTGAPLDAAGTSTPEFLEVVTRNKLLATFTGNGPATAENPSGFGSSLAATDVEGDGFSELTIGDPRRDGQVGGVAVHTLRGGPNRLVYIDGPAAEGANATFGDSVAVARVGTAAVVFAAQRDVPAAAPATGGSPGGVYAFPLECSASLCEVSARTPQAPRAWSVRGTFGDDFGAGVAWLGTDTLGGQSGDWLAVASGPASSRVALLSATAQGLQAGASKSFAGAGCSSSLVARLRQGTAAPALAMSCATLGGAGVSGAVLYTPSTGQQASYVRTASNDPAPSAQPGALFGQSVAILADLASPADGRPDLLLGWPGFDGADANVGRAELWRGSAATPTAGAAPYLVLEGDATAAALGFAVTDVGDFDGDGVSDFAVAIPGTRTVHVYSGLSTDGFKRLLASISVPDEPAYAGFGEVILGVGDVNGDGFADLAIAAPRASITVGGRPLRGAVYVYSGGSL